MLVPLNWTQRKHGGEGWKPIRPFPLVHLFCMLSQGAGFLCPPGQIIDGKIVRIRIFSFSFPPFFFKLSTVRILDKTEKKNWRNVIFSFFFFSVCVLAFALPFRLCNFDCKVPFFFFSSVIHPLLLSRSVTQRPTSVELYFKFYLFFFPVYFLHTPLPCFHDQILQEKQRGLLLFLFLFFQRKRARKGEKWVSR